MRIAQIAPLSLRIPPKKYGGTERVIYALTEELVKRGHDVTLFASGDSATSAKLVSVYPKALIEAQVPDIYGANYLAMLNIGNAYQMQDEFDIIHDHNQHLSLPTANLAHIPVVMTLHGAFNFQNRKLYETLNKPYLVTISKAQAVPVPDLHYIGNVYHGLDMRHYPFSKDHDGYLLFVGRLSREKGVHEAIEVAEYLDLPLIIAAKVDSVDEYYYKNYVEPRLTEKIRWIGEVTEDERNKLMSKAMAFLHPVTWREPFGLTMIEAMACGCPVIAYRRGSVSEIVQHKKTGFIVEDAQEMIQAVTQVQEIDREYCRQYALENFSAERMTDGYETVYQKILQKTVEKEVKIPNGSVIGNGHARKKTSNNHRIYLPH